MPILYQYKIAKKAFVKVLQQKAAAVAALENQTTAPAPVKNVAAPAQASPQGASAGPPAH